MVSYYDKLRASERQTYISPLVSKLQGVFDSIDDAELIKALTGNRKRSCKGYSAKALWRSYLTTYVLDINGVNALIRQLEGNPALCEACGIDPQVIPHKSTYSRFINEQLVMHTELVEKVFHKAVDTLKEHLDDFGKILAVDFTDIKAHSKPRKSRTPSDADARWGFKKKDGKPFSWFGYKVHMVCDAVHELPINFTVTPANASDYRNFIPPLEGVNVEPDYVLADAGYDAVYNYVHVVDEMNAIPIIDLNKRGRKGTKPPHRAKAELYKYELRNNAGIDRDSREWKRLYDKRVSVERLFSRAKGSRRLNNVHYRGMAKVRLHVLLSTLSIVASAMDALYSDESVRKVA